MRGLGLGLSWLGCGMLVLIFCCYVVGVCVCLGLGQCFRGSECAGDGFLGIIINLFYYKLKEIREATISIYSNQGCVFC